MDKRIMLKGVGTVALLLAVSGSAWGTCTPRTGTSGADPGQHVNIDLGDTLVSTNTMRTGIGPGQYMSLFEISHSSSTAVYLDCSGSNYIVREVTDMPHGLPTLEGVGSGSSSYISFPTNINGIGFVFNTQQGRNYSYPKNVISLSNTLTSVPITIPSGSIMTRETDMIGDYGVISGADLPSGRIYVTESATGDFDDTALLISTFSFTGRVTIRNPTCHAIDKTVQMGTHHTDTFAGRYSTTPWVDSSVTISCDGNFYGTPRAGVKVGAEGGVPTVDSSSNRQVFSNTPFIRIRPVFGTPEGGYIYDDEDPRPIEWHYMGVIALDDAPGQSATGVAIQLSKSDTDDGLSPWSSENLWEISGYGDGSPEWQADASTVPVGSNSFTIPLFARYVQIAENITPGRADSKVIYTLNYK